MDLIFEGLDTAMLTSISGYVHIALTRIHVMALIYTLQLIHFFLVFLITNRLCPNFLEARLDRRSRLIHFDVTVCHH